MTNHHQYSSSTVKHRLHWCEMQCHTKPTSGKAGMTDSDTKTLFISVPSAIQYKAFSGLFHLHGCWCLYISLADSNFFCQFECIYTLTWEDLNCSFLLQVESDYVYHPQNMLVSWFNGHIKCILQLTSKLSSLLSWYYIISKCPLSLVSNVQLRVLLMLHWNLCSSFIH